MNNKIIITISLALILLSSVAHSAATTVTAPATLTDILKMKPEEFVKLDQSQAMDALNKLSNAGETKKLTELFNQYARDRMGINANFNIEAIKTKLSAGGLNAPNGNFLEFESLKGFIKSKIGQIVSIRVTSKGFEISTSGSDGSKTLLAQGFDKVKFKEGKVDLDGSLLETKAGQTVATKEGIIIKLDGQGTITPKGGKAYEFHGKSSLAPNGRILVEPSSSGENWVKVMGQRIIPKSGTVAVYTSPDQFSKEKESNKVLIVEKNGRVIINPQRQSNLGGEFDIGRAIYTIGPKGTPVIGEEIISFPPDSTKFRTIRPITFDSLFAQLESTIGKKGSYLKMGRENNPALVSGLQKLLGIEEVDSKGGAIFGPETKAALVAFQKKNGMTGRNADGILGPNTYDALTNAYSHPSAFIVYAATDGTNVGISDSGVFKANEAEYLRQSILVPRTDSGLQETINQQGARLVPGGNPKSRDYVPSTGNGYTPDVTTKGQWKLLKEAPAASKVTDGEVTFYYTPVWDPNDKTGVSHKDWDAFMAAVKLEGSGMLFKDGQWYHVDYKYARAYINDWDLPALQPLTNNLRYGEVAAGGTPIIGSIAAPPGIPFGSKAYVQTVGGEWVELVTKDRGQAIQKTNGRYHIDVWAGVGLKDYDKGRGSLTGKYKLPKYPEIRWVFPN